MSPDWSAQEEPVPYAKLDDPQSLNLYSYVKNNPLTRPDPDGHCPWCIGAAVGALVGSGVEAGAEAWNGESLSGRKILGAAIGGAIAGGTFGLASEAGVGVAMLAGAGGNTAGGIADRAISTGEAKKALDKKEMLKDAAWGAGAALAGKGAEQIGARLGGSKQLEALEERAAGTKLGPRHAASLARQRDAAAAAVKATANTAEKTADVVVESIKAQQEHKNGPNE